MTVSLDLGGNNVTVNTILSGSSAPNGSGAVIVPAYEYATSTTLTSSSASQTVWVCPNVGGTYQVAAVTATQGTASSSGTLQVEVATGTQAIGSGTNQLTGTVSLSGTANTPVNGTLITTPTTIAAGNRINLILAGTLTSLANCVVNIALQRIS
jgi:hypothetical protein